MQAELSASVVRFCRKLRESGLPIVLAEEEAALKALDLIRIGDPEEFRLALRTVLPGSRKELAVFDDVFPLFWGGKTTRRQSRGEADVDSPLEAPARKPRKHASLLSWSSGAEEDGEEALPGYSPAAVLRRKDFSAFGDRDVDEAIRIMRALARVLARRLSRRYMNTQRRSQLDFRKTIRSSLRTGGEIIDLRYRRRNLKKTRIVAICDVSGSMESYSRFLITFLYAIQHAYGRIETFVFSTSLHRVTEFMKAEDLRAALRNISETVQDWSGGTRIGECLQAFLDSYAREHLNQDTVVLILSDGWDIGEPELLQECVKLIRQKSDSVLWLNPLAGAPDFEPTCGGMQAALPHIDFLLPAHNLESLRSLSEFVARKS